MSLAGGSTSPGALAGLGVAERLPRPSFLLGPLALARPRRSAHSDASRIRPHTAAPISPRCVGNDARGGPLPVAQTTPPAWHRRFPTITSISPWIDADGCCRLIDHLARRNRVAPRADRCEVWGTWGRKAVRRQRAQIVTLSLTGRDRAVLPGSPERGLQAQPQLSPYRGRSRSRAAAIVTTADQCDAGAASPGSGRTLSGAMAMSWEGPGLAA